MPGILTFIDKNKKIKKESIADELARYYKDYQNWNKVLNKKWDLLLNPQSDEFQFYKQVNYELNAIKDLKIDIDKIKNNSIANILPKINNINNNYNPSLLNSHSKRIETTNSDNENSNDSNMKAAHELNNSNIKYKYSEKINIEDNSNCESSDDSLPKIQKEQNSRLCNRHSINGTKLYKGKISSRKNLNKTMDESLTDNDNNNNDNNNNSCSNTNISLKVNPNSYTSRIFNKIKPQSNFFMTNIGKTNIGPSLNLNEKISSDLEHQLNLSIETINYNHGNISSRSFRDPDIRGKSNSEKKKSGKQEKSLIKLSREKSLINSRKNTKFNSIDEESNKATASFDSNKIDDSNSNSNNNNNNNNNRNNSICSNNSSSEKLQNSKVKKDVINLNIFNIRTSEITEEESIEQNKKKQDDFGSTKLILSQSVNLKTNKLRRLHHEHMPRYYSNKFSTNSSIEELDDFIESKQEEEKSFPKKNSKRRITPNDPIENIILKQSTCFVPFSVDNSIKGIKKLNKRIQMLAPKKKYNFIINNY